MSHPLLPSLRRAVLFPALLLWILLLCSPRARAAGPAAGEWAGPAYIVTGVGDLPLTLDGSGPDPDFGGYPLTILSDGRTRDLAASAAQPVTVTHSGGVWTGTCEGQSFSALLQGLGAAPGPGEGVLVSVSLGHIKLTVSSRLTYYDRDLQMSYYQTVRRANPALKPGQEQVVQVGRQGEKVVVYEVEWSNGAVIARHMVELLDSAPVDEIIEYGPVKAMTPVKADPPVKTETPVKTQAPVKAETPVKTQAPVKAETPVKTQAPTGASFTVVSRDADQKGGVLTLPSGEVLRFSKSISMTATAYTTGYDGVGTVTASGTNVHVGVVAVDPKVIPLGTKLYIIANGGVVYGKAAAEDTGVRGNSVDLYMNTYRECINFGRRGCMVYVLE